MVEPLKHDSSLCGGNGVGSDLYGHPLTNSSWINKRICTAVDSSSYHFEKQKTAMMKVLSYSHLGVGCEMKSYKKNSKFRSQASTISSD